MRRCSLTRTAAMLFACLSLLTQANRAAAQMMPPYGDKEGTAKAWLDAADYHLSGGVKDLPKQLKDQEAYSKDLWKTAAEAHNSLLNDPNYLMGDDALVKAALDSAETRIKQGAVLRAVVEVDIQGAEFKLQFAKDLFDEKAWDACMTACEECINRCNDAWADYQPSCDKFSDANGYIQYAFSILSFYYD